VVFNHDKTIKCGTVEFDSGTFYIPNGMVPRDNITVKGQGIGITVLKGMAGTGFPNGTGIFYRTLHHLRIINTSQSYDWI